MIFATKASSAPPPNVVWNAAGGIVWATAVGLAAYYGGKAAGDAVARYGVYGGIAVGVLVVLVIVALHLRKRRSAVPEV